MIKIQIRLSNGPAQFAIQAVLKKSRAVKLTRTIFWIAIGIGTFSGKATLSF